MGYTRIGSWWSDFLDGVTGGTPSGTVTEYQRQAFEAAIAEAQRQAAEQARLAEQAKLAAFEQEQKAVADVMNIRMAGGEEEFRMRAFRWLIANDAFDIVQPDQLYFGGLIRSMHVARMAAAFGQTIVPHMTTGGLGYLYMLHFVSACENAGEYHEFKLFATKDANGTMIPIESKTEPFTSKDGIITVPTGSGLGLVIDPDYIKTHRVVTDW